MKLFVYTAKSSDGNQVKGKIEAPDKSHAIRMLKEKDLFILSLDEKGTMTSGGLMANKSLISRRRIRSEDLMIFTRELSTMISAGFPLLTSIEILREDLHNPDVEDVLIRLASNLKEGQSLSASLEQYPDVFPRLYINLVKAGEASGELERILQSLAQYLEISERIRRKIQASMVYPVILIITSIIIVGAFVLYAIPKFKKIYDIFDSKMPVLTRIFLDVSSYLQHNIVIILLIIAAAYAGLRFYLKTPAGRRRFDRIKLTFPYFNEIYRRIVIARFSRTLALLYSSGVPLLEAFSLVANVSDNVIIVETITNIAASVQEGESITAPLKKSGLFPSMALHMIDIGEKSGTLDKMLIKIADLYDFQVENWLSSLTTLLEPLLIMSLGLLIGFFVLIMALPILTLPTVLQP